MERKAKHVYESKTTQIQILMPRHINGYNRLFGGQLMQWIDVVVEGRFIEALRDTQLRFRGSPNQRIVDVAASKGKAVPVELTEYY